MSKVIESGLARISAAKLEALRKAPVKFASTLISGLCRREIIVGEFRNRDAGPDVFETDRIQNLAYIPTGDRHLIGIEFKHEGRFIGTPEYGSDLSSFQAAKRFLPSYLSGVAESFESFQIVEGKQPSSRGKNNAFDLLMRPKMPLGELDLKESVGHCFCLNEARAAFANYAESFLDILVSAAAKGFSTSELSAQSSTAVLTGYGVSSWCSENIGMKYTILGNLGEVKGMVRNTDAIQKESDDIGRLLIAGLRSMTFKFVEYEELAFDQRGFTQVFEVGSRSGGQAR